VPARPRSSASRAECSDSGSSGAAPDSASAREPSRRYDAQLCRVDRGWGSREQQLASGVQLAPRRRDRLDSTLQGQRTFAAGRKRPPGRTPGHHNRSGAAAQRQQRGLRLPAARARRAAHRAAPPPAGNGGNRASTFSSTTRRQRGIPGAGQAYAKRLPAVNQARRCAQCLQAVAAGWRLGQGPPVQRSLAARRCSDTVAAPDASLPNPVPCLRLLSH
jgi:hypothetical protein